MKANNFIGVCIAIAACVAAGAQDTQEKAAPKAPQEATVESAEPAPEDREPSIPPPILVEEESGDPEETPAPSADLPAWWNRFDDALSAGESPRGESAGGDEPVAADTNADTDELPARQPITDDGDWDVWVQSLKSLSALLIVLALLALCVYVVKRWGARTRLFASSELGEVLGRLHLTPKASLHFVRTGGKVLVVGVTSDRMTLLAQFAQEAYGEDIERGETPALSGEESASAFAQELSRQSSRMDDHASANWQDADVANLRGDLERLQKMLRDAENK